MTRRDWWFGVSLLALAISIHAMVPRYVWTHVQGRTYSRTDRWTGDLQLWVGSYDTLKRVVAITPAQHEGEGLDPLWHSLGWNHDGEGWYWHWYTKRRITFSDTDIDSMASRHRAPRTGTFRNDDVDLLKQQDTAIQSSSSNYPSTDPNTGTTLPPIGADVTHLMTDSSSTTSGRPQQTHEVERAADRGGVNDAEIRFAGNIARLLALIGVAVFLTDQRRRHLTRVPHWKGFGYAYSLTAALISVAAFYGAISAKWMWLAMAMVAPIVMWNIRVVRTHQG